jgi:2-oxo-4-hydroxy-4-carboxy--5-ureidoimidazoline (OHCU) decarboxylase
MTVGAKYWIGSAAVALVVVLGVLAIDPWSGDRSPTGPTVGEKVTALRAERASLQARADGEARITLVGAFRVASQLADALAVRAEHDRERSFADLAASRRQAFAELDALNIALKDALARPGVGGTMAARAAADRALAALERLAGTDDLPLVLQFTPRFVPPRRATGGSSSLAPAKGGT